MSKLHELLAVEGDLRTQAESCRKDLQNTFEKKQHHFSKKLVVFKSKEEGVPDKVESQLALQSTVHRELDWISEKIAKALDAGHHIDCANTTAKADLVLEDGTVLLKSVPATSLRRLTRRRALSRVQTRVRAYSRRTTYRRPGHKRSRNTSSLYRRPRNIRPRWPLLPRMFRLARSKRKSGPV